MAESPTADPFSPLIEPSNNSILIHPDLVPDDRCVLQGGFQSDLPLELDFDLDDINWDLSVDDLLISECQGELSLPFPHSCDGSPTQNSGISSSSPVEEHASGNMSVRSPESGHSANYSAESIGEVKQEVKSGWGVKRKNEREEGSANSTLNPRSSKFRRGEEINSGVFNAGSEEEEKRSARLIRNRESAQLSRQRKKHYVEELEEKVRSMNSTIMELNSKISFFMTENASLKQKLGGNGSNGAQSGVCIPAAVPPIHFPWIPFPGIAFRPQGSPVPLVVPIPKLKLQQPANGGKVMKSEGRKGGRKTKKVASISLLGFLFVMITCRVLVPGLEHIFEENKELVGLGQGKNRYFGDSNGRVLSVSGISGSLNYTNEVGFNDTKALGEEDLNRTTNRSSNGKMESEEKPQPFDDHSYSQNSSETLPALLYVSRNGKHVKINGNLIINSVLASEKAASQAKFRNHGVKSATKEDKDTTFEVPRNLAYALALSRSGNGVSKHSKSHGSSAEQQRARSSDSEDLSKEKTQDGPLQQWFLEGLAGPIFSSGACTEVFRFEISPSSVEQSGIIPSSPSTNSTKTSGINATGTLHGSSSCPEKKKNRRFLYPRAIPLAGTTLNNSEHLGKEHNHLNASAAPLVVSILADPREVGDGDVEEIMSAKKSISRIFVVVLLDSVKYVTYSCVLPFMSPSPHLVN